jgi:hypothetical protein
LLILAEPGSGLPAHLLEQPEPDVGGGELRVDGGLLEPLRVEVLRGAVAHRQPELLQILQIQAAVPPLLGRLPALLILRDAANEVRHADPEQRRWAGGWQGSDGSLPWQVGGELGRGRRRSLGFRREDRDRERTLTARQACTVGLAARRRRRPQLGESSCGLRLGVVGYNWAGQRIPGLGRQYPHSDSSFEILFSKIVEKKLFLALKGCDFENLRLPFFIRFVLLSLFCFFICVVEIVQSIVSKKHKSTTISSYLLHAGHFSLSVPPTISPSLDMML